MSEEKKFILCAVVSFLLGIFCILSISIPVTLARFNRADTYINELTDRLAESNRKLETASTTVMDCRKSVERITSIASTGTGTLTEVINNLKRIRDEIQKMEEGLYRYEFDSDSNNRDNSNNSVE